MRCGAFPLADDPYILHSQLGVVDPEPVALVAACPFAEEFIRKVRAPRLPKQLLVAEQAAIYRTIPEATVGANGLTDLHAPMIENLAGVPVYLFKGVVHHVPSYASRSAFGYAQSPFTYSVAYHRLYGTGNGTLVLRILRWGRRSFALLRAERCESAPGIE